jgi:hypothetical protein
MLRRTILPTTKLRLNKSYWSTDSSKVGPFLPRKVLIINKVTRLDQESRCAFKKPWRDLAASERAALRLRLHQHGFDLSELFGAHIEQNTSVARIAEALSSRRIDFKAVSPLVSLPEDWDDNVPTISAGAAMYVENEEDDCDPSPPWWMEEEVLLDSEPRWEEEEVEDAIKGRTAASAEAAKPEAAVPAEEEAEMPVLCAADRPASPSPAAAAAAASASAVLRAAAAPLSREIAGSDLLISAGGDDAFLSTVPGPPHAAQTGARRFVCVHVCACVCMCAVRWHRPVGS